jgi:hypothetical protein
MSETRTRPQARDQAGEDGTGPDSEAPLSARLEVLREENERLREEYAATQRTRYRTTALGLAGIGVLAGLAGVLFPPQRTVLFALAGTGLFVGVLTYYLTPEQFFPARIGTTVYEALAANEAALTAELGLEDEQVYVPVDGGRDGVRLFVPQHADYELPSADALGDVFVVTDDESTRGIAVRPTGVGLLDELTRTLSGGLGDDATTIATQLSDALVEQFELVERAQPDVDDAAGQVTVAVTDSAYGSITDFDHPVASVLAVGLARGLDVPVTLDVEARSDDRADYVITCRWAVEATDTSET